MSLLQAPFGRKLKISSVSFSQAKEALILEEMGIHPGAEIEKLHAAPLGSPITLRVASQRFAIQKEVCGQIEVEIMP